jgi:hypothetical protein
MTSHDIVRSGHLPSSRPGRKLDGAGPGHHGNDGSVRDLRDHASQQNDDGLEPHWAAAIDAATD